jgi:hypothetical protein
MTRLFVTCLAVAALSALISPPAVAAAPEDPAVPRKTLSAFASEQELAGLFKRWADEAQRRRDEQRARRDKSSPVVAVGQAGSTFAGARRRGRAAAASVAKEAAAGQEADSVTNVQHAGVDEGGIVKAARGPSGDPAAWPLVHRQYRRRGSAPGFRGRSVRQRRRPGRRLVRRNADFAGNTIVVIGYSYARGGTEIGVFDISRAGQLTYRATYHLRSNDYYSSRNYASRLIGSKLIVYSPHVLSPWGDPWAAFPAMRRWRPRERCRPISGGLPRRHGSTVPTRRSTRSPASPCTVSRSAISPSPRWTARARPCWGRRGASSTSRRPRCSCGRRPWRGGAAGDGVATSAVFRIPPRRLGTECAEDASAARSTSFPSTRTTDGMLNVLLRSNGRGDGHVGSRSQLWRPGPVARPAGELSPMAVTARPIDAYRRLPKAAGQAPCRVAISVRICCTAPAPAGTRHKPTTQFAGVRGALRAG